MNTDTQKTRSFGATRNAHEGSPRPRSRQRGSAITELAVITPLLLIVAVGLTDLGRAASEAIDIENAAHAGASYAARSEGYAADASGIRTAALADLGDDLDTSHVTVESLRYCECPAGGSIDCADTCAGVAPLMYVRVRVEKQFQTLLDYPGVPHSIDLDREAYLRVR
jgi:Flp pilus assembly protein TadG